MGKWIEEMYRIIARSAHEKELILAKHQLSELSWAYDDINFGQKYPPATEILIKAEKEFEREMLPLIKD